MNDAQQMYAKLQAIMNDIADILPEPRTPQTEKAIRYNVLWLRAFAYELANAYHPVEQTNTERLSQLFLS